MALRSAPLLLLALVKVVLRENCFGASSHSMKYFSSSISEPSQGQPHFVSVGYVDGQVFVHYDSNSRREQPRVSWMEKVGKEDPQYWDRETQRERGTEEEFKESLESLRLRYNQSEEPPEVTMSSRTEVEDGMETHICRVDGFYPREIEASWTRDGEVWLQDTLRGAVAPNADGTFHAWLSIQIDPKERGRYLCHVEHDGLQEPLDVALKEPKSNLGIIIGCVVAGLVSVFAIVGTLAFIYIPKRRQDDHNATPSELSSLQVISNLKQGPEAPSVERK
ncbi:HLA class I histocompatibility antigen, B alpha chain-like isoform X2 [Crotalus tigris]|uniref:HLA class I histocompatibility antigen, B alpha chain-like isoform X2 n=1 Tax=Crotalus tigris TaxID=88082 RepID=UPI00192FA9F4|nr:HLA class I histocompatibility antigen, B alpha chain-like isoform X2 [Crotalus tigris]